MKIVLWIGNQSNQKALANKLHSVLPLSGIVMEARKRKNKMTFSKITGKVIEKFFLSDISRSWFGMINAYERKYPTYPETNLLNVDNINSEAVYHFTNDLNPDLVVVSGTS